MPAQKAAKPNSLGELVRAARYGFRPVPLENPKVFVRLTPLGNDKYKLDAFAAGNQEFLTGNPRGEEVHLVWWEDPDSKRVIADVVAPFLPKIRSNGFRSFTITEMGELLETVEN